MAKCNQFDDRFWEDAKAKLACDLTAKLSSLSRYYLVTSVNRPLYNHFAIALARKYWISKYASS